MFMSEHDVLKLTITSVMAILYTIWPCKYAKHGQCMSHKESASLNHIQVISATIAMQTFHSFFENEQNYRNQEKSTLVQSLLDNCQSKSIFFSFHSELTRQKNGISEVHMVTLVRVVCVENDYLKVSSLKNFEKTKG